MGRVFTQKYTLLAFAALCSALQWKEEDIVEKQVRINRKLNQDQTDSFRICKTYTLAL